MDLAAAAGVTPSTLNTMLDPDWTNRAVANVEAIEAAYLKIKAKDQRAKKRARSRKEIRPDWAD